MARATACCGGRLQSHNTLNKCVFGGQVGKPPAFELRAGGGAAVQLGRKSLPHWLAGHTHAASDHTYASNDHHDIRWSILFDKYI